MRDYQVRLLDTRRDDYPGNRRGKHPLFGGDVFNKRAAPCRAESHWQKFETNSRSGLSRQDHNFKLCAHANADRCA